MKQADLKGISFLIIADDPLLKKEIRAALEPFRPVVHTAGDVQKAAEKLALEQVDVILSSLDMADEACIDLVRKYKAEHPETLFYLLTEQDYHEIDTSLESVRLVVDDYIPRPMDAARFVQIVQTSLGKPGTGSTSLAVIEPLVAKVKPYFLFRSEAMRRALAHISEIAASGQTVLISGETGTGKELVARAIHVLSPRANGPFIPINCSAIPESLVEGELFGHEKGAFTGAIALRRGKFETANHGTLFLDEIGDMAIHLQARLLRVLEEKKVYRIGGETPVPVDTRMIAATHMDLEKAVGDGLFREDLYYRLNVLRIHLPPLRERVEDIPLLAVHFLERAFSEMGRMPPYPELSAETIYLLEDHPWKGNVRELRNIMTRVATLLPQGTKKIFPFHIQPHLPESGTAVSRRLPYTVDAGILIPKGTPIGDAEGILIREALKKTGGNRSRAAELLGISLRTLRRRLNKK